MSEDDWEYWPTNGEWVLNTSSARRAITPSSELGVQPSAIARFVEAITGNAASKPVKRTSHGSPGRRRRPVASPGAKRTRGSRPKESRTPR